MKKTIKLVSFAVLSFFIIGVFFEFGASFCFAKAPNIIKFATLAPEGSTWTKVLHDIDEELNKKSEGKLRLKIYSGGVSGDEKDVVRKMRIGQVHSAGFTGVGLGEILPEVRILDLPFFLKTYDEIDHVRTKFQDKFSERFEKRGYVFLGWTEVGFVYFYSATDISSIDSLRSSRMWMWEGDPIAKALFDSMKVSPTPLAITDVLTSLQTGLIDSIYISPLGIIALQWFQKVKYMLDFPMADATGALLITKKQYAKLSPELQSLLKETFMAHSKKLLKFIRRDNEVSINAIKESGVKLISIDEKDVKEFEKTGVDVRESLAGGLYPKELLKEIVDEITKFRKK